MEGIMTQYEGIYDTVGCKRCDSMGFVKGR